MLLISFVKNRNIFCIFASHFEIKKHLLFKILKVIFICYVIQFSFISIPFSPNYSIRILSDKSQNTKLLAIKCKHNLFCMGWHHIYLYFIRIDFTQLYFWNTHWEKKGYLSSKALGFYWNLHKYCNFGNIQIY